ncbi:MAG TPA: bifunctional precorrin-2 dehydrogenase/sirohydrochlorin ferrochelatase [Clostridiaceae bacterium]
MSKYYPIMVNLEYRNVLIVGGGEIAYKKLLELLEYKAVITLVSLSINEGIKEIVEKNYIKFIEGAYDKTYLEGAFIVIASTNDREVNNEIYKDCIQKSILVNIVDDPENCSFITPSKLRRGDLTISISTNGKSPTLSKEIRKELEISFDESYEAYVNILGDLRKDVIANVEIPHKRKEVLHTIVSGGYLGKLRILGEEAVRSEIKEYLQATITSFKYL